MAALPLRDAAPTAKSFLWVPGRCRAASPNLFGLRTVSVQELLDAGDAGPVIRSTSAISSAESSQFTALTFASTCSGRVAPAITLATAGRAASQENASSSMLRPRAEQKSARRSILSQFASVRNRSRNVVVFVNREPSGIGLPRLYFPVNNPPARGKYGSRPRP